MNNITRRNIYILALILLAVLLIHALFLKGFIVLDRSARRVGEGLVWQGVRYIAASGDYTEKRTVAKTDDGWNVVEIEEDPSHTYVVMRSFLDNYLLVREDYTVPTSGRITSVSIKGKLLRDAALCATLEKIISKSAPDFEFKTDNIYSRNDRQIFRSIYVGYEDSPIASVFCGHIGTYDGVWYYIAKEAVSDDTVRCYTIPDEFIPMLEENISMK